MSELLLALHIYFISPILTIFFFALLVYVIMSWLLVGGVVDQRNQTVRGIYSFLDQIIEPVVRPVRRVVPPLGSLDLSILVIALAIPFLRDYLIPSVIRAIPF
ncbi:MAG: YggT family protein [Pseudomonadota bacterium]